MAGHHHTEHGGPGESAKLRSRNAAISVLVLAYSMFGIVGFVSGMISPTPIVKVISSGLTIFSYTAIAILSKRLSFRELFTAMLPLNLINIVRSYADLGLMILKYQGGVGEVTRTLSEFVFLASEAHAINQTVTPEMVNEAIGPDAWTTILQVSHASNAVAGATDVSSSIVHGLPVIGPVVEFFFSLPEWVGLLAGFFIIIYMVLDSAISILSNLFTLISSPIILVLSTFTVIHLKTNIAYIYIALAAWLPIAATVDSFTKIYVFRILFFRFMRNHPFIAAYAEGGPL